MRWLRKQRAHPAKANHVKNEGEAAERTISDPQHSNQLKSSHNLLQRTKLSSSFLSILELGKYDLAI